VSGGSEPAPIVIRSKFTASSLGEFPGCVSVHTGLLRTRSQGREKPAWRRPAGLPATEALRCSPRGARAVSAESPLIPSHLSATKNPIPIRNKSGRPSVLGSADHRRVEEGRQLEVVSAGRRLCRPGGPSVSSLQPSGVSRQPLLVCFLTDRRRRFMTRAPSHRGSVCNS
jgi:hypothetical protein